MAKVITYPSGEKKCDECGRFEISGKIPHSVDCSETPIEKKAIEYERMYKSLLAHCQGHSRKFAHLADQITFWQGKFHALRHENNKLRRKAEQAKEAA